MAAEARRVNSIIVGYAFNDVRNVQPSTTNDELAGVISYIVFTLDKVAEYGEFLDVEVTRQCVETLEYVLRIDHVMN